MFNQVFKILQNGPPDDCLSLPPILGARGAFQCLACEGGWESCEIERGMSTNQLSTVGSRHTIAATHAHYHLWVMSMEGSEEL